MVQHREHVRQPEKNIQRFLCFLRCPTRLRV